MTIKEKFENKDKAATLLARLELIQMKDIALTPDEMLERFGVDEVGFFYKKICVEKWYDT